MVHRRRRGRAAQRRGHRRRGRPGVLDGAQLRRGARLRPPGRRPGAAGADVPPARRAAQGRRFAAAREPRRAVRAVGPHRRHPRRFQVRHRRRLRRAARLRQQGQARTAQRVRLRRGRRRAAEQGRHVRRAAHPDAAARRRRADQRVQLPGVGAAGEVRAGVPRGRPVAGQAGQPDRLPHRADGRADRRVRAAARGHAAVRRGQRGRPARPPDRAGPGLVHRLGVDGRQAAHPPDRRVAARCGSTPRPTR